MSSRPLLIAGIVGGVVAGAAMFTLTLVVVATDSEQLSASTMAMLVVGTALGWVLDATWLCVAVGRLTNRDDGGEGDDDEGGDGWGRPGPDPARPWPPPADADWWPEFERDLRRHLKDRERPPVAP